MTLSRRSTIRAIGVVGAGSTLTGTVLAQDDEGESEETSTDEVGSIRVGHFAPDAPNVDVYVDDQQILTDVGYGVLSPYLGIEPGTYTVAITPAGEEEPVLEETVPVETGYYTVAAIGELEGGETADDAGGGGAENESVQMNVTGNETESDGADAALGDESGAETGSLQFLVLADDEPDDVQEGAHVRLVHASPDAPTVDVAESENGATIFEDVAFTEPSGYVPVDPEIEGLGLFPADDEASGEDEDDELGDDDVISQADPVVSVELDLEEGQVYTGFVIGYLEGEEGLEVDAETDDSDDDSRDDADEDDRSFDVYLALDGTTEEAQTDDREADEEDDELEAGDDVDGGLDTDAGNDTEREADDGHAGYGNETSERNGSSGGHHEEPTAADD